MWVEDKVGPWFAGYQTASGRIQRHITPADPQPRTLYDYRIWAETTTVPAWDSRALRESYAAAEIGPDDVFTLVSLFNAWCERLGAQLLSGHGPYALVHGGSDVHLHDGTIHVHPWFLTSAPLVHHVVGGFVDPAGLLTPGRLPPRRDCTGGELLGQRTYKGILLPHTLGVPTCAYDAWSEAGLPPRVGYGDNWDALLLKIDQARRRGGRVANPAVGGGAERMPFDIAASRFFRQLVRELAERTPALQRRREAALAETLKNIRQENAFVEDRIAGKKLREYEAKIASLEQEKNDLTVTLIGEKKATAELRVQVREGEINRPIFRDLLDLTIASHREIAENNAERAVDKLQAQLNHAEIDYEIARAQAVGEAALRQNERAAEHSARWRLSKELEAATTENAGLRQKVADSATTVQQLQLDLTQTTADPNGLCRDLNRRFARLTEQMADLLEQDHLVKDAGHPLPWGLTRPTPTTLALDPTTRELVALLAAHPLCPAARVLQNLDRDIQNKNTLARSLDGDAPSAAPAPDGPTRS